MKVKVDYDRCEGHGMCVLQAPDAFQLDDDGDLHYQFGGSDVPADQEDQVRSAIDACPVLALGEAP